jgi:hypothetical protein
MLGTHRRSEPQFAHDPQDFDGHIRAIRPVAQVFCQCFFATVNSCSDGYLRHRAVIFRDFIVLHVFYGLHFLPAIARRLLCKLTVLPASITPRKV